MKRYDWRDNSNWAIIDGKAVSKGYGIGAVMNMEPRPKLKDASVARKLSWDVDDVADKIVDIMTRGGFSLGQEEHPVYNKIYEQVLKLQQIAYQIRDKLDFGGEE